tara:strand:+ start:1067 stop:1936 length:870 start_codon:yes stop_codon:yes gene_type:complete
MGGKGRAPAPVEIDPGQSTGEYLFGKDFGDFQGVTDPRLQERIIAAEEQFRPRYAELELKDIQTFTRGTDETGGLFDLLEESGRRASAMQRESLQAQREADVGALKEFAPQVVEAYRAADPTSARLADLQAAQAERLFAEAEGPLSPERRRMAEQQARAGSLARGRIGDESSVASEILGREQFRSGLRQEARQAGQLGFTQSRAIAGDIGATILGRPSQGLALGGSILGQAQAQAAGPMGPQLFDPNVGINLALQQRAQDIELQGAQAAARGAAIGGLASGIGSIIGGM